MRDAVSWILAEVSDIARQVFEDPTLELTLDTISDDVPRWDSMSHVALMAGCEMRFDLRFTAAETEDLHSVRALVRLIQTKLELIDA